MRLIGITIFALALVAAGCSGSNSDTSALSQSSEATQDTDESASAVGSEDAGDLGDHPPIHAGGGGGEQTPVLIRVVAPPEPVKGSDGELHLVYELELTNASPGTVTVESV